MSNLIATKRVDLLAPYLALDQGPKVMAECESFSSLCLGWVLGGRCAWDSSGTGRCLRGFGYDDGVGKGMEDYGHPA
jgi:hypothetical protein